MAIEIMVWVWNHSVHEGTALNLMLALADFANNDGVAWPSVKTLAQRIRRSERQTQFLLAELEASGEVERQHRNGRESTLYRVVQKTAPVRSSAPVINSAPVQPIAPEGCSGPHRGGEVHSTGGVKPAAPNPSGEPSEEPSLNRHSPQPPKGGEECREERRPVIDWPSGRSAGASRPKADRDTAIVYETEIPDRLRVRMGLVGAVLHRRPSTPWRVRELRAARDAGLEDMPDTAFAEDLGVLQRYYRAHWDDPERNFCCRDFVTLCNKWSGHVPRVASWLEQERRTVDRDGLGEAV